MVAVGVNVQIVDARAKVVHELAQGARGNGPVVRRVRSAKLGVHRHACLKGEAVGRREARPEDDAGDEAALDAGAVLNGDVAAVNQGLLLRVAVPLAVGRRAATKERDQRLGVALTLAMAAMDEKCVRIRLARMYMVQWKRSLDGPAPW